MWPANSNWQMTLLFLPALALLGFAMKLLALLLPTKGQIQRRSISWVLVSVDSSCKCDSSLPDISGDRGLLGALSTLGQPLESLVQRLVSLLHLFPTAPMPGVRLVPGLCDFRPHARVGDELHTLSRHGQSIVRLNHDLISPSTSRHSRGAPFLDGPSTRDADGCLACGFFVRAPGVERRKYSGCSTSGRSGSCLQGGL